jgi:hypothetical protein
MPAQALIRNIPQAQVEAWISANGATELLTAEPHGPDVLVRCADAGSGTTAPEAHAKLQALADEDARLLHEKLAADKAAADAQG